MEFKKRIISLVITAIAACTASVTAFADIEELGLTTLTADSFGFAQEETEEYLLETSESFLVGTAEAFDDLDGSIEPRYSPVEALHKTYPDGSHYSANRKKCTCHSWCDWDSNCNCTKFALSSQCMAFAKYCHSVYNDFEEYIYESISGNGSEATLTEANLYSYLQKIGGQAYVRGRTSTGSGHSVFIVGYTKNNVTIYDANYTSSSEGDYCVVHNKDLTYSDFLSRIKYFQFAMTSEGDIINAN